MHHLKKKKELEIHLIVPCLYWLTWTNMDFTHTNKLYLHSESINLKPELKIWHCVW